MGQLSLMPHACVPFSVRRSSHRCAWRWFRPRLSEWGPMHLSARSLLLFFCYPLALDTADWMVHPFSKGKHDS